MTSPLQRDDRNAEALDCFAHWRERGEAPLDAHEVSYLAGYQAAMLRQSINARVHYSYPGSDKAWFHFSGTGKELLDVFALSICDTWPMHWLTVEWTDWVGDKLVPHRISVAEPVAALAEK